MGINVQWINLNPENLFRAIMMNMKGNGGGGGESSSSSSEGTSSPSNMFMNESYDLFAEVAGGSPPFSAIQSDFKFGGPLDKIHKFMKDVSRKRFYRPDSNSFSLTFV